MGESDTSQDLGPFGIGYDAYLTEMYTNPERHAVRVMESWAMIHTQRDKIIFQAWDAGISMNRIAKCMNIGRTTVKRILANRAS